MFVRELISTIYGNDGSSPIEAAKLIRDKGVVVSPATVEEIRFGEEGYNIRRRVECAGVLASDDASKKNALYRQIASQGVDIRQPQETVTHRFDSYGFTEGLAEAVSLPLEFLRKLLMVMRMELSYTDKTEPDEETRSFFIDAAGQFLNAYTIPLSRTSLFHPSIKAAWDGATIEGFYQVLYSQRRNGTSLGTLVPYEMEAMDFFYKRQIQRGSHLTNFDRLLLNFKATSGHDADVNKKIGEEIGIRCEKFHTWIHLNALLYGAPSPNLVI